MRYLLILALFVAPSAAADPETLAGPARVIDGDSLEIADQIGIDAPEGNQICQRDGRAWSCGDDATAALAKLVTEAEVGCDLLRHDRWQRALGVCFADGIELNRETVRHGWALAHYPERGAVPGPIYDAEQFAAEQAQRGLTAARTDPDHRKWRAR